MSHSLGEVKGKYALFNQHLQTFLQALSNTKNVNIPDTASSDPVVKTASQINHYHNVSKHAVEKRTFKMFLDIHHDMESLRQSLEREIAALDIKRCENGSEVREFCQIMSEWGRMGNAKYDFHELRAPYPHREINHLSCVQARERYGGAVSILPILLDYAENASKLVQSLKDSYPKVPSPVHRSPVPSRHVSAHVEEQVVTGTQSGHTSPRKKLPVASKKRLEKYITEPDWSLRLGNGSLCCHCKKEKRSVRGKRHGNGGEEVSWQPTRVWRGASKGAVNHVAHRYCACQGHEEARAPDHSYHAPQIY